MLRVDVLDQLLHDVGREAAGVAPLTQVFLLLRITGLLLLKTLHTKQLYLNSHVSSL